jgi:hypothetical protein
MLDDVEKAYDVQWFNICLFENEKKIWKYQHIKKIVYEWKRTWKSAKKCGYTWVKGNETEWW